MTKADLVTQIMSKTGLDREETSRTVEAFMECVKDALIEGERLELRGFGTFQIRERKAKLARNIAKQESILIPARRVPVFKPSPKFSEQIAPTEVKKKKNKV